MDTDAFHYAGWFTLDVRLGATVVVFALAVATFAVAWRGEGKRWQDHVVAFAAVFLIALLGAGLLTNWLAGYPALRIETVFPVP